MIPSDWIGGIIGFSLLFIANPIQWHRILSRKSVDDISMAWIGLPIVARFFMGFTAIEHPVWLWGNSLILISCIMTIILVMYFKRRANV